MILVQNKNTVKENSKKYYSKVASGAGNLLLMNEKITFRKNKIQIKIYLKVNKAATKF